MWDAIAVLPPAALVIRPAAGYSSWPVRCLPSLSSAAPNRALAGLVLLAAGAVASLAVADAVDPARPSVVVVGPPRGYAPAPRLDPDRHGLSAVELPSRPSLVWRREVSGGLDLPPVVDAQGGMWFAGVSPEVRYFSADGRARWRTKLGSASPALPPVLTSDGSVALVSVDGSLWRVAPGGAVRSQVALGISTKRAEAPPLAFDDGSVVVAGERSLVQVGADGSVRRRVTIENGSLVGAILPHGRGVLVTLSDGRVLAWQPPEPLRELGSFGGRLDGGAVRASERTLVGVVDKQRLVALDVASGSVRSLARAPSARIPFEGPPSLDPSGVLLLTTVAGELLRVDARGQVVRGIALDRSMRMLGTDGGRLPAIFRRLQARPSPPLVVDGSGQVAFVRSSGRVGLLAPNDAVHDVHRSFCARPIALLPAGARRLLVVCRSGSLGMFAEATP
jgi:hypothetical protein